MRAHLTEMANKRSAIFAACALCAAALSGCETTPANGWNEANSWQHRHENNYASYSTVVVRPGDTLSEVAERYDDSTDEVARANDIPPDATLYPGDVLHVPVTHGARHAPVRDNQRDAYVPPPRYRDPAYDDPAYAPHDYSQNHRVIVRREPDVAPPPWHYDGRYDNDYAYAGPSVVPHPRPAYGPPPQSLHSGERLTSSGSSEFCAPVSGRIIENFGDTGNGQRNDGINIAASVGTPIRAAGDGTVTYAGNELKGYGNLILIQHDGGFVTAYAHANSIGVARGQHVARGDVIGTVGQTGDVDRPQLHFEIRRDMKPLDPRPLVMASAS